MKTRLRFVSNSSSSSFVLVYDPKDFVICEHCGRGYKDPATMMKKYGKIEQDWGFSNATHVLCDDPQVQISKWQEEIVKLQEKMDKLSTAPAGAPVLREGEEEATQWTPRVWQEMKSADNLISLFQRKIKNLEKIVASGKTVLWAIVNSDDPLAKVFQELEAKGLVQYGKDL